MGLVLLIIWPLLIIGLSVIGERLALIYALTLLSSLPALIGAVAWFKMGQQHSRVFLQKRLVMMLVVMAALSVPVTHWPLRLAVRIATPALNAATVVKHETLQVLAINTCGNGVIWFKEKLYRSQTLPRVGVWGKPVAGGKDLMVLVTLRPAGARLLLDPEEGWEILY